jgi:hypothetical protein
VSNRKYRRTILGVIAALSVASSFAFGAGGARASVSYTVTEYGAGCASGGCTTTNSPTGYNTEAVTVTSAAGDTLVAVVDTRNLTAAQQVSSISDNSGSSDGWQQINDAQANGTQDDAEIWFTATPLTAAATTVTITVPVSTGVAASIFDVTPSSAGSFAVVAGNNNQGSSSTDAAPLSVTSGSGDFSVSGMGWNGTSLTDSVLPVSPGWTTGSLRTSSLSGDGSREEAAWEQASSTSTSVTDTLSGNGNWANVIADLEFAPQASGTISAVQNFGGSSSSASTTVSATINTPNVATTAGDLLVANIVSHGSTSTPSVTSVTDTAGSNTWYLAQAETLTVDDLDEEVWYTNSAASIAVLGSVTATTSLTAGSAIEVTEFRPSVWGTFSVWNAHPSNNSSASTLITGQSSNSDTQEDLAFAGIGTKNRQGTDPTWTFDSESGSGWQSAGENSEVSGYFDFEQSAWDTTGVESMGFSATLVSASPWTEIPVLFEFSSGLVTTPTVTSVSPSPAPDGYSVTVYGSDFTNETDVKLGTTDVQSTVMVNSDGQLSFTVPSAEAAGTYSVYVSTGGNTNSSGATLQVVTNPYIQDFSPTSGPETTTSVVLTGYNLGTTSTATVKLGTTAATITANSGSFGHTETLTFTVPTIANGSYTISDTVGGNTGTTSADNPSQFTVNTSSFTPPHIMIIEEENAGYNDTLGTCVGGDFKCYATNNSACGSGSPNYTDALDPYLCYLADHYAALNSWTSAVDGYNNSGVADGDCTVNGEIACHPSEINYLAITGGDTDNCTSDDCGTPPYPYGKATNNNIFNQLTSAGIPWADFNDDMPSNCDTMTQDGTNNLYVARHNPGVIYMDLASPSTQCSNNDLPLGVSGSTAADTPADLATTLDGGSAPDFVFLTPDLAEDAHGCAGTVNHVTENDYGTSSCNGSATNGIVESMNNWLAPTSGSYVQSGSINGCTQPTGTYECTPVVSSGKGWLPAILGSTWFTGSTPATVIVTMDESDHPNTTPNIVPMVVISNQGVDPGRTSTVTPSSHGGSYSLLASIDTAYHLGILGPASNLSGLDNFLCNGGSC